MKKLLFWFDCYILLPFATLVGKRKKCNEYLRNCYPNELEMEIRNINKLETNNLTCPNCKSTRFYQKETEINFQCINCESQYYFDPKTFKLISNEPRT